MYYFGNGVAKNYDEAARLFKLAAAKNDEIAQYMLGNCYANAHGVARDDAEAARLFKLAADRGNPLAQNDLARLYEKGLGVPKNTSEAMRLYRAAADQGNSAARLNLTRLGINSSSKTAPQQTGTFFEIPLRRQQGVLVVPVSINNAITVNFVVDSGAADVTVPEDVAQALLRAGAIGAGDFTGKQTYVLADGSRVASKVFLVKSLKVGNRVLENVRAGISAAKGPALLGQLLSCFKTWSIDNERSSFWSLQELPATDCRQSATNSKGRASHGAQLRRRRYRRRA